MTDEKAEGEATEVESSVTEDGEEKSASPTAEASETEAESQEGASKDAPAQEEDEVVISIGEEPPPPREEPAPSWVKELRKSHKELQRKNRELEERLRAAQPAPKPVTAGPKPTLESCDYDADKFESEIAEWYERKRKADDAEASARKVQEAQQQEWQSKLQGYAKSRSELKVSDFEEAEAYVTEHFNTTQQGIIIQGADNPHHVVYALGKNKKKAKELASITDPIRFAVAVAKLEGQLKVMPRKPSAEPEKPVSGTGRVSGAVDSTLERLRAEAEKTGNYSKVIAYKNSRRKSG